MPSVQGTDDDGTGYGVQGTSASGHGVDGLSEESTGARGRSSRGTGVLGFSKEGTGISAESLIGVGLHSKSEERSAIVAESNRGAGVNSTSQRAIAVQAESIIDTAVLGLAHAKDKAGLFGRNSGADGGSGVVGDGKGTGASGVIGNATYGIGVFGNSGQSPHREAFVAGVVGNCTGGPGVMGLSQQDHGVSGQSSGERMSGVRGENLHGHGVSGRSMANDPSAGAVWAINGSGVWGDNPNGIGVNGTGRFGVRAAGILTGVVGSGFTGVQAEGQDHGVVAVGNRTGVTANSVDTGVFGNGGLRGVVGVSYNGTGVRGESIYGPAIHGYCIGSGWAGYFDGDVRVTGTLRKTVDKFLIDHPLDPANKYLEHSAIESSDMKNIYDGTVSLDEDGSAEIELPDWFEALNERFCYQLTAVGRAAPGLHVSREIAGNKFAISGGPPDARVCWQVTGLRRDAWARANPMQVEQQKPENERGLYVHPQAHGASREEGIAWARNVRPEADRKEREAASLKRAEEMMREQVQAEEAQAIPLPPIPRIRG